MCLVHIKTCFGKVRTGRACLQLRQNWQALSKIINDLHTFSTFHLREPEVFYITGVIAYPPMSRHLRRPGCMSQMGHKHPSEASEDYHLLYSNTHEEFRWAHELARLGFSQENSV